MAIAAKWRGTIRFALAVLPALLLMLLSSGRRAEAMPAIVMNTSRDYSDQTELTPVCSKLYQLIWPKTLESPEKFDCRIGIYKDELVIRASTDLTAGSKSVSYAITGKDSFALLLDAGRNLYSFYLISVDFTGEAGVYSFLSSDRYARLPVKVRTKTEQKDGLNVVTAFVPLKEMLLSPGQGDVWGIGVMRYRMDESGKAGLYHGFGPVPGAGSGVGFVRFWCTSPNMYTPLPRTYRDYTVGNPGAGISLGRGNLGQDETFAENRFTWTYLKPPAKGKGILTITYRKDNNSREETVSRELFSYGPGQASFINCRYTCPADKGIMSFRITDESSEVLYQSSYPLQGEYFGSLAGRQGEFNAESIVSRLDPRLGGDREITWASAIEKNWVLDVNAVPSAFPYDYEEWLDYYRNTGKIVILTEPGFWGNDQLGTHGPAFRKAGLKCALMPTAVKAKGEAPYQTDNELFLPDPKLRQAYMDAMTDALKKYPDVIRYIYIGDELTKGLIRCGIYLYNNKRTEYPFIEQVNEDVKKRFGAGKYGIPTGFNDDRFKWLAYRRWMADFMEGFCREAIAKAKAVKPDIMFISPDPPDGNNADYFESWRGLFDIATHQSFRAENVPFSVKLLKDLTGAPHVWPCPHLEPMATVYPPLQLQDILSECFMAGADGLHTWPVMSRDAMVRPDRIDSPGARGMWDDFDKLMSHGMEARHGQPQVALLYSNDSYAAGGWAGGEIADAYKALGPELGIDFKIAGDLGLERGHDDLKNFKVLIAPYAEIERNSVIEKIVSAVREGLVLVVRQPNAFSLNLDGENTTALSQQLLGGARMVAANIGKSSMVWMDNRSSVFKDVPVTPYGVNALTAKGEALTFADLPSGTEVLALHSDKKTPAVVMIPVGKGKVIWMGAETLIYPRDYASFCKYLFKYLDIPTDQSGWRIKLPLQSSKKETVNGVWLTGNRYATDYQIPQTGRNVYLPGSYRYSLPPDTTGGYNPNAKCIDVGNKGDIPFTEGSLTDRGRSTRIGVKYNKLKEAFSIDFDLTAEAELQQADLYVTGYLGEVKLLGSKDGRSFAVLASFDKPGDIPGLERLSLKPANGLAAAYRYLRLAFGERPEGKQLTIAEVDIIGR